MKTCYLKIAPTYFDAVSNGEKPFEVRKDDRGFQKGDLFVLCRYGRQERGCGGSGFRNSCGDTVSVYPETEDVVKIERRISCIPAGSQFGVEAGHIVMGLSETKVTL